MRTCPLLRILLLNLLLLPSAFSAGIPAYAHIETSLGSIWIELNSDKAPRAVKQFTDFVKDRVYEKSAFHSSEGNGINGGKPGPRSKGYSKSGNFSNFKPSPGEFELVCDRACIGFSRTMGDCNPDKTNNSTQFFIQHQDSPTGGKDFTIFGKIVSGFDVLDKIYAHLSQPGATPVEMSIRLSSTLPPAS